MLFMNNNVSWIILSSCFHNSCFHEFHVLCFHEICDLFVRKWSSIFIFCSFCWDKSWKMIFMKFFYQNWCVFLYCCIQFSCSSFIFFSFDQKFKLFFLNLSSHVINQVNKIQVFFTFNNHEQWFRYLLFYQIMLWE